MRLWPRSLAGRTTLVLIAGMLVILWLGAMVWGLSVFLGLEPRHGPRLIERIATVVTILDRLPPESRPRALRSADSDRFRVFWSQRGQITRPASGNWIAGHTQRRLRRILRRYGLGAVMVGRGSDSESGSRRPDLMDIRLSDGSWLTFAFTDEGHGAARLISVVLVILIVGGGLTGLAVWVSRRVTAPLGRFSAAAARLGTNIDAPPLDVSGPSEIREAARVFNEMQHRIRRFVEDRTLMIAAISHDLRTILTRLRLRAEFIEGPGQQAKALADLDQMEAMLASTLSFARDDAAAETLTRVDLSSLLQTLCDDLSDGGHRASFEGPPHLTFVCRPMALRRALANLIENAAKFGQEAAVTLAETPGSAPGSITVEVADRGPGIPPEMREKVFSPFFRLDSSRSLETGGTGLGLAVARNSVRGHGGDITLHKRPGGGLIARVVLPHPERP